MKEAETQAILEIGKNKYELPVLQSTIGPNVIDMSKLYSQTGYFAYDPGFMSTASCESKITYIDGDAGILKYKGYDIKFLAEEKDFVDVMYLLLHDDLPKPLQKKDFWYSINHHSLVHEKIKGLFSAFHSTAHPMSMLISAVGYLSSMYPTSWNVDDHEEMEINAIRMISKISTLSAMIYKYHIGQPFIYPRNDLGFTENFLHMMFATPCEDYYVDPVVARALDKIFILHADHEQNASTSTVKGVGSTAANIYACISAGVSALWGPAHGGANEAVIEMLKKIGNVKNIDDFITQVKNKTCRLMGFGHRVYKNHDPRAEVLKASCKEVLEAIGKTSKDNGRINFELLDIALKLEEIALKDDYFISRKLYPNVDFYSGIIYSAIGIPSNMFTVMFALARTCGWIAQWLEMKGDKSLKLTRPRQLYTGLTSR